MLQLEAADMILEVLQDAAERAIDLTEVGEQHGWALLVRGRALIELQIAVSVHVL